MTQTTVSDLLTRAVEATRQWSGLEPTSITIQQGSIKIHIPAEQVPDGMEAARVSVTDNYVHHHYYDDGEVHIMWLTPLRSDELAEAVRHIMTRGDR